MTGHRYILEPYKGINTRYRCPSCEHRDKTFSRYIDTETGENIHPSVGRCNREINCGYHYTPKHYFQDNNISYDKEYFNPVAILRKQATETKPVSFIPVEIFKGSRKNYETNHFVKFLSDLFGIDETTQLISKYFIGSSKHWNGATVFWQIDITGKIRTGKIMLYNPSTGKRVKEPYNHINWVHTALKLSEFELKQCLFGEHLLHDKIKPVAIVESEKTAVIASLYLPQFNWLAIGSLTNLNAEKCHILKGHTVTLFPDLNCFDKWSNKVTELSHLAIFTVSDLLERKATRAERKQGLDLADYLIRFDYRQFFESIKKEQPKPQAPVFIEVQKLQTIEKTEFSESIKREQLQSWEPEITELEYYFKTAALPGDPVKLNPYTTITNASLFINSHFATVKANNGKRTFLPYLNRLQEFKLLTLS